MATCKAMDDGQRHHYVGVADRDGRLALYVDGQPLAEPCYHKTTADPGDPSVDGSIAHLQAEDIDSPCDLCIGVSCQDAVPDCGPVAEYLTGEVDEVAVYSAALDEEEVAWPTPTGWSGWGWRGA